MWFFNKTDLWKYDMSIHIKISDINNLCCITYYLRNPLSEMSIFVGSKEECLKVMINIVNEMIDYNEKIVFITKGKE